MWWNRDFRVDGHLNVSWEWRDTAIECAKEYTHQICLGDLGKLRNFLEVSIKNSDQVVEYFVKMPEALNKKGQNELLKKGAIILSSVGERKEIEWMGLACIAEKKEELKQSMLRAFLGMTRKREFLNDAWADSSLWLKG